MRQFADAHEATMRRMQTGSFNVFDLIRELDGLWLSIYSELPPNIAKAETCCGMAAMRAASAVAGSEGSPREPIMRSATSTARFCATRAAF